MIAVDLLIVGALSIDRFPDGRRLAGGSVLHAARAAHGAGHSVATLLVAGPERQAAAAALELASLGPSHVNRTGASARFAIDERGARRRIVVEAPAARLRPDAAWLSQLAPAAVLLAPVAGELTASAVRAVHRRTPAARARVASLQGWLRRLRPGQPVGFRPAAIWSTALRQALGTSDACTVSREDLPLPGVRPEPSPGLEPSPGHHLAALREVLGPRPALLLTDGLRDAWLAPGGPGTWPAAAERVSVSRPVSGVSTVGAGDGFAALLAAALGAGVPLLGAADSASAGVGDWLSRRAATRADG